MTRRKDPVISAIDLFCGAGGLSQGLTAAGVKVVAGIDVDPACRFAFEENIGAQFIEQDVRDITGDRLNELWEPGTTRLLAGCAPCQPFSPYRRGIDTSADEKWPLLDEFRRLVNETRPDLVTMENVPRIGKSQVFVDFVEALKSAGYHVDWRSVYGPKYGLPQHRRRLVLVASLLRPIAVPVGTVDETQYVTVRDAVEDLPAIQSGESDPADPLHVARNLSPINIQRLKASKPGGTWLDWPEDLRADCHKRATGASFKNVYARMDWDLPAPTITTLAHNFGAGRFGHPTQHRAISLREAAILQGFPRTYKFVPPNTKVNVTATARLIGNAVPPPIARAVGNALINHINDDPEGAQR